MNIINSVNFENFIIRKFNNDNNYKLIGCFKEPDFYTVIFDEDCGDDIDDPGYFNTTLDFEVFVSNAEEVEKIYNYMFDYIKRNNQIDEAIVFGMFLNGEKSCLICSDNDYSYGMYILKPVLLELNIKSDDTNYFRKAHANDEEIEEEYPIIYHKIKDYFHQYWGL